jgi:hypothetical protein
MACSLFADVTACFDQNCDITTVTVSAIVNFMCSPSNSPTPPGVTKPPAEETPTPECTDVEYYTCLHATFQALVENDFASFCTLSVAAKQCLSDEVTYCGNKHAIISLSVVDQVSAMLQCGVAVTPTPPSGCDAETLACLKATYSQITADQMFDTTGMLSIDSCSSFADVADCMTAKNCEYVQVSVEAYVSMMCEVTPIPPPECTNLDFYNCMHAAFNALVQNDYATYCTAKDDAHTCLTASLLICSKSQISIALTILQDISNVLHCDQGTPQLPPSCEYDAYVCLKAIFSAFVTEMYDSSTGLISSTACAAYGDFQACLDKTCLETHVSVQSFMSFSCDVINVPTQPTVPPTTPMPPTPPTTACTQGEFYACLHNSMDALVQNNYNSYCSMSVVSRACLKAANANCPNSETPIALAILDQISATLTCSTATPNAPKGCEMTAYTCLKTSFNGFLQAGNMYDSTTQKLSAITCSAYADVATCIFATCANTHVSEAALVSFMCENTPLPQCDMASIMGSLDNLENGYWKAQRIEKQRDNNQPDHCHVETLKRLRPQKRHPACDHGDGMSDLGQDCSDDVCWYLQDQVTRLYDSVHDCSPFWKSYVTDAVYNMDERYMVHGECDHPCNDHQCVNGAHCKPDGYGYDCECMPGFTGPMCDRHVKPTCDTTGAIQCIGSLRVLVTRMLDETPVTQADCSSLDVELECIGTSLAACDNDVTLVSIDVLVKYVDVVKGMCSKYYPPPPTTGPTGPTRPTTIPTSPEITIPYGTGTTEPTGPPGTTPSTGPPGTPSTGPPATPSTGPPGTPSTGPPGTTQPTGPPGSSSQQPPGSTTQPPVTVQPPGSTTGTPVSSTKPPPPTPCEVQAALNCTFDTVLDLLDPMSDDSYCVVMKAGFDCAANIETACPPASTYAIHFRDSMYASMTLICPIDQCSVDDAMNCIDDLRAVIGQPNMCPQYVLSYTCVVESMVKCSDYIKVLVEAEFDALIVTPEAQCINPCDVTPCHNGGMCVQSSSHPHGYKCMCTPDYEGTNCDETPQCDMVAVAACFQSADLIFTDMLNPGCAEDGASCSELDTLSACINLNIEQCNEQDTGEISVVLQAIASLQTSCTSTNTSCVPPPPECKVTEMEACTHTFLLSFFDRLVADSGVNNVEICADILQFSSSCISATSMTNCPDDVKSNVAAVNAAVNLLIGTNCAQPHPCNPSEATKCVNALQVKVGQAQMHKFFPHEEKDTLCAYVVITEKCVTDNIMYCSPSQQYAVQQTYSQILDDVSMYCPLPCNAHPCDEDSKCMPDGYDKYSCKCSGDQTAGSSMSPASCDHEHKCHVDVASQCVVAFEVFVRTGHYLDDSYSRSSEFCKAAEVAIECVKKAFTGCTNPAMKLPHYRQIFAIKHAVGWTCYTPCHVNPCENRGVCMTNTPDTLPVMTPPTYDHTCKCLHGASGTHCEITTCSQPDMDSCLSESTSDFTNGMADSTCRTPPDCTSKFSTCGMVIPGMIKAASANLSDICKNAPECFDGTLTKSCNLEQLHMSTVFSNYTEHTNDAYCTMWADLRRCMSVSLSAACVKVVTALDSQFQMFCVHNPVPVCDMRGMTKSLEELNGDLELASDTQAPTPPPQGPPPVTMPPTPPPSPEPAPKPTPSRELNVMCNGGGMTLYVDGTERTNSDDGNNGVKTVALEPTASVIAIHGHNAMHGNAGGCIAWVKGFLHTDDTWRCFNAPVDGWMNKSFDDAGFANAVVATKPRAQIPKDSDGAQFIWTGNYDMDAYCIYDIPPPPAPKPIDQPNPPTEPPQPKSSQPEPNDACRHAQDLITVTQKNSINCMGGVTQQVSQTINGMLTSYSMTKYCQNQCDHNRCMHKSTCVPQNMGYYCQCMPGYSGRFCETGDDSCDLPKGVQTLVDLKQQVVALQSSQTNDQICTTDYTKIDTIHQSLSIDFMPCSDLTKVMHDLVQTPVDSIRQICSVPNNPPPTTPPSCEVMAIAMCVLNNVDTLFGNSADSTCAGLLVVYDCINMIALQCDDTTVVTVDASQAVWRRYDSQCPHQPNDCSLLEAKACISSVVTAFPVGGDNYQKDNCGMLADAEACVSVRTVECDAPIKTMIQGEVNPYLEPARENCTNPCIGHQCQNAGLCLPVGGDYSCVCNPPYTGTYCDHIAGCDLTAAQACFDAVSSDVIRSVLDPCRNPFQCAKFDTLQACISANIQQCSSDDQTTVNGVMNAFVNLKTNVICDQAPGPNCPPPPTGCQYEELHQCIATHVQSMVDSTVQVAGTDYQSVCSHYTSTETCIKTYMPQCHVAYLDSSTATVQKLIDTVTKSVCNGPICIMPSISAAIAKLTALVDAEISKGINNLPRILMQLPDKDSECSMIEETLRVAYGAMIDCTPAVSEQFNININLQVQRISSLCPMPCETMNPCSQTSNCVRMGYAHHSCDCSTIAPASTVSGKSELLPPGCYQNPTCMINEAYECIDVLVLRTIYKGEYSRAGNYMLLPPDFDFCAEVVKATACITKYAQTCDDQTKATIFGTVLDIQTIVNTVCVDGCVSTPCNNYGMCTPVNAKDHTCQCRTPYTGENCDTDNCPSHEIDACFRSAAISILTAKTSDFCPSGSSNPPTLAACVSDGMMNCSQLYQDVRNEAVKAITEVIPDLCNPTTAPPSTTTPGVPTTTSSSASSVSPTVCDLPMIQQVCADEVAYLTSLVGSSTSSDSQVMEMDKAICRAWFALETCLMTSSTSNCVAVIGKVRVAFGMLCRNPKIPQYVPPINPPTVSTTNAPTSLASTTTPGQTFPPTYPPTYLPTSTPPTTNVPTTEIIPTNPPYTPPPNNATCSLNSSEDCMDQLEGTLFRVQLMKRTSGHPIPKRPQSEHAVGDMILPPCHHVTPDERVDLCGDIYIYQNCSLAYAQQCGDNFEQIFTDHATQLLSVSIGSDDVCSNLCDENPCLNFGSCTEYQDGFSCECMEGFMGKYCEIVPQCDYYAAMECLDIFTTSRQYFENHMLDTYCSSLRNQIACLITKLLVCSDPDYNFVEMIYFYMDSLTQLCDVQQKPTCEHMELYVIFQELVNVFYSGPGPANSDREKLCTSLQVATENVNLISKKCSTTTSLSVTAVNKLSGTMDLFCDMPTCSLTIAHECLEKMYYSMLAEPFTAAMCDEHWKQKKCVLDATIDCPPAKMQLAMTALSDMELINPEMNCPNPCSPNPCRNGGMCRQSTVDDYMCTCMEEYTGKYCETPKGCDFPSVVACLDNANQALVDGLHDRCHPTASCGTIESVLACIAVNTKSCDASVMGGINQIVVSIQALEKMSCNVIIPLAGDAVCDTPPTSCDLFSVKQCYATFTKVAFDEMASVCVVDYAQICTNYQPTLDCITKASAPCPNTVKKTITSAENWLDQLTLSHCKSAVCIPESAAPAETCVTNEIDAMAKRNDIPDSDRSDFCTYVDTILSSVEDNVAQCAAATKAPILAQTQSTRSSLSNNCTFPCQSKPCKNNGACMQTTYNDYTCQCVGDWAGKNCDQAPLYPNTNDTQLHCRDDQGIDFAQIQLLLPIMVFCESMHSFTVSQDGYISFSSTATPITSYDSFCDNGQNIIAALFAQQDCSCDGSSITVHVYNPSETSDQKSQVFARAARDLSTQPDASNFTAQVIVVVTFTNMMPYPCGLFKLTYPDRVGSTYQLVLISDSIRTYVEFLYQAVDVSQQVPNVHMGMTDTQGQCVGTYMSGTMAMNNFQTQTTNTGELGMWIFEVMASCVPVKPNPETQCLNWASATPDLSQVTLDSCACSSQQASIDPRYHIEYIDYFSHCYVINRIQQIGNPGQLIQHVQQVCCYNQFSNGGPLYTSPPYAGNPVLLDPAPGQQSDADAFNLCCVQSNKYCNLYQDKRPTATCNAYTSCMEGLMWGDPHIITTDNFKYTVNPIGEFVMINTTDNSFRLQARIAQMITSDGSLANASVYVAFVAQETGSSKVQVELNANRDSIMLYIDGVLQNVTASPQIVNNTNIYISASTTGVNVTFSTGWTTLMAVSTKMLSIRQTVPGVAWKKTVGLLGTYDGDMTDDLTAPDGTVIPITSSNQDIYYKFALKWQISAAESLFTYFNGKTAADYVNANFVPAFDPPCTTDADKNAGTALCGDDQFCYFDYCVTKDATIASGTLATSSAYNSARQILINLGPQLSIQGMTPDATTGVYSIQATVGQQVSFTLYAVSTQTVKINIEAVGNVSKEAQYSLASLTTAQNSTSSLFKWTPTSLSPVDVSFMAVDANGAISAKLQAIVTICNGCGGQGSCQFGSSTPIYNGTAYRLASCSCNVGWTGTNCTTVYDGCQTNACSSPSACTTLTPSQQASTGLSFSCSSCPPGFYTEQCIAINDCKNLPMGSACQICVNTVGGHVCECNTGYRLNATNQYQCIDIDECAEHTDNCPQVCTNTIGSYTCSCYAGYSGPGCSAITSCAANKCSYKCAMINNKPTCSCLSGFALATDGISCNDINECSNPTLNMCSDKSKCNNTIGGYTCGCVVGETVGNDLRVCQPCSDTTWGPNCANDCNCGPNVQTCSKTTGCTICNSGWQGANCATDIDECAIGTAKCQAGSSCLNVPGTYYCMCSDGVNTNCYVTTQQPCSSNPCLNGGSCFLDSNSDAMCTCASGYTGDMCETVMDSPSVIALQSRNNVALIAGLSTLGAVLLIAAAALIFFCFILPKIRRSKKQYDTDKVSDLSSTHGLTKFNQSSTRINQWWPRNPERYVPETYTGDAPSV